MTGKSIMFEALSNGLGCLEGYCFATRQYYSSYERLKLKLHESDTIEILMAW